MRLGSCAVPCMLRTGVPGKSAEVKCWLFDVFHLRDMDEMTLVRVCFRGAKCFDRSG